MTSESTVAIARKDLALLVPLSKTAVVLDP